MFLPKAGVFADGQARVVAENIAADIAGESRASRFTGQGFCYIEVGDGMAAYGSGNFYGIPGPRVTLEPPSQRYRQEKEDLARFMLRIKHELGVTILWVEHDIQLVGDLTDRIAVLHYGRKISEGTPIEVLNDPLVLEAYLGGTVKT